MIVNKNYIRTLREGGNSLNEIMKETGLKKGTVYYHIKGTILPDIEKRRKNNGIILNEKKSEREYKKMEERRLKARKMRLEEIPIENIAKELNVSKWSIKRYIRGLKIARSTKVIFKEELLPIYVRIFSHVKFDGYHREKEIQYFNKSKSLIENFFIDIKKCFPNHNPKIKSMRGCWYVSVYGVGITKLMEKFIETNNGSWRFRNNLLDEFGITILKSFFDDEGSVSCGNKSVDGTQSNKEVIEQIKYILDKNEIKSRIYFVEKKKSYRIMITDRNSLIKFRDKIGFSDGVFVNRGKNKGIEKRIAFGNMLGCLSG